MSKYSALSYEVFSSPTQYCGEIGALNPAVQSPCLGCDGNCGMACSENNCTTYCTSAFQTPAPCSVCNDTCKLGTGGSK